MEDERNPLRENRILAADLHCDTMLGLWLSELRGSKLSFRDTGSADSSLQIDLKKLREGEYLLQNFALYIDLQMPAGSLAGDVSNPTQQMPGAGFLSKNGENPAAGYVDPWFQFTEMLRVFREAMDESPELIRQVRTWEDIEENRKAGRISALLTVEEGGVLQGDIRRLDRLYEAGVRMMTLTWNYENELGFPNRLPDGIREDFSKFYRFQPEPGRGLTGVGKEAVRRMEELGILPDVSHLSDEGFYDTAAIVKGPFVASHSNARALCGCFRNLTDDMIRVIAEHGGVIGINFCPSFLTEAEDENKCRSDCEALAAHARHIMDIGGREIAALGTDFDGIPRQNLEIEDASQIRKLADYMLCHGFSQDEVEGLYFKNILRLYRECL